MNTDNNSSIFFLQEEKVKEILFDRLSVLQKGLNDLIQRLFNEDNLPNAYIFIATIYNRKITVYKDNGVYRLEKNNLRNNDEYNRPLLDEDVETELCEYFCIPNENMYSLPLYGEVDDYNNHYILPEIIIVTENFGKFAYLSFFYERFCFSARDLVNYTKCTYDVLKTDEIINLGLKFLKTSQRNEFKTNSASFFPDFYIINKLSALPYESQECNSNIICVLDDIDVTIKFDECAYPITSPK